MHIFDFKWFCLNIYIYIYIYILRTIERERQIEKERPRQKNILMNIPIQIRTLKINFFIKNPLFCIILVFIAALEYLMMILEADFVKKLNSLEF